MSGNERISTDLCVIGAGSGGLSIAAGAAQMGARVTLIERGLMGGDCLNYGCVPSKALLAAAKRAETHRSSSPFGVAGHEPDIDFAAVNAHVRSVIGVIEPHDSQERFEGLGVRVIRAGGSFVDEKSVRAGGSLITARRFIISTGSRPRVPPTPGLSDVRYFTNETIFTQTERPRRLVILGGGPIGLEMAQAHRRLGSEVVVVEPSTPLRADDPALAEIVLEKLKREGVDLRVGVAPERVSAGAGGAEAVLVHLADGSTIAGSHLLVATGRAPNIEELDLDAAGVAHTPQGITVDARLRTSNKRVFAIGDVAGGMQFTHVAGYHAGVVIRNALFRIPAKASYDHIPRTTYTDPELAQVGLTEAAARERHGDKIDLVEWRFRDNDRAQAERATDGLVKVAIDKRGRILGAGIAGSQAGELIQVWALALSKGLKIKDMTGMVAPYPTLGEVSKRVAGQYYAPKLFSGRTRWVVRQLLKLG